MNIEITLSRKHLIIGVLLIALLFGVGTAGAKSEPPFDVLEQRIADLETQVADLESLLVHFSRDGDDVYLTGANLHVVNGLDQTDTANSLGNIIIGYNELRYDGNDRSGSHMLVLGKLNNYSTYGGIISGVGSKVSGAFASVTGGSHNEATGEYSSVSGGYSNYSTGRWASTSGGAANAANGESSSINGGQMNNASGNYASVNGGESNIASGGVASVSGGMWNTAEAEVSAIGGGQSLTTEEIFQFLP